MLNGIINPSLQEIGTLNFYGKAKQFSLVEHDQEINVNKFAGVEAIGIT
jgi:hypothetical protein